MIDNRHSLIGYKNMPTVSIITPSYNQGMFIEQTICSILAQSYPQIEYIIADGASSDNTPQVIARYRDKISILISEPDSGQASAINKGIMLSTGEIIGWINSDDILYEDTVQLVVHVFNENPYVDVVYGNVDYGPSPECVESVINGKSFDFLDSFRCLSIPIPQQGCFWRRSAQIKCGVLDEQWHYVLDRDYFIRLADKCNLMYIDKSLGFFRSHPESKSFVMRQRWISELIAMYSLYYNTPVLRSSIEKYRREVIAAVFLTSASLSFKEKDVSACFRYTAQAFKADPLFMIRPYFLSKIGLKR